MDYIYINVGSTQEKVWVC